MAKTQKTTKKTKTETDQTNLEWDLMPLYVSLDDPELDKDITKAERAYARFEKQFRDADLGDAQVLLKALKAYEKLLVLGRPIIYLYLEKYKNSALPNIDARINQASERLVKAQNKTIFFHIALAELPKSARQRLLKDSKFEEYNVFLTRAFAYAPHVLTEKEEALWRRLSQPAFEMWTDMTEKILTQTSVKHAGKNMLLAEAMNRVSDLPTKGRRALHARAMDELKNRGDVAEAEMNAVLLHKKISDDERGFKRVYSDTLLSYDNTEKELAALRESVKGAQNISRKFYKLKRDALGLEDFSYADRNVPLGKIKTKFGFKVSADIVRDAFAGVDERFANIFDAFIAERRIDVLPRHGKQSGAFCLSNTATPTYVLLNHVSTYDSLSTLAHEMGHAIHSELSKSQRPLYEDYSTSVAEFASTFFEEVLAEHVLGRLPEKEQAALLHQRINRDISTVFRQMAFFEFEYELHGTFREKGFVPKEEIASLLTTHMKHYLGPAVSLSEDDGYFFVYLSHIRRFFYVYSYAYGSLLSRTLFENIQNGETDGSALIDILSAGGSENPHDIFKKAGIDTEKKETFETALKGIDRDIKRLKKLLY